MGRSSRSFPTDREAPTRTRHGLHALALLLVLLAALATPAADAAPAAVTPTAAAAPSSPSAETGPDAQDRPSVSRPLLMLLGAAALVATAGALWQERGSPRALAHGRVVRRPRHEVGTTAYRIARRLGFRYSHSRDALVLRWVGNSIGPVLRLRTDPAPLPLAAPARTSPGRSRRTVDLACLPLPATQHGRLWQMTAVDVGSGYTWAELTRPRGAAPSPEQTLAFVQRIAAQLAGRSLQLDAVVVQAGSTHRRSLATAVELADVRLLRTLPGGRRLPVAAQRHQELVAAHWNGALASAGAPPLDVVERQLQRWVAVGNETAGGVPADGAGEIVGTTAGAGAGWAAPGLSPTEALGGATVVGNRGRVRPAARDAARPAPVGSHDRR